jgi:hypothetical protein
MGKEEMKVLHNTFTSNSDFWEIVTGLPGTNLTPKTYGSSMTPTAALKKGNASMDETSESNASGYPSGTRHREALGLPVGPRRGSR